MAEKDLVRISDNHWEFSTAVCSYEGIGRFVAGLFEEVEIVEPVEFKTFVSGKMEKGLRRLRED
ncbi:MAG: hypothetical protein K9H26_07740 [Prolixibacteraceae bacterium]|nr:hypothetical protein [Prolixibacteraceae bacterium]